MRKTLTTGTLAGALLVGGAAGAIFFGPATANAQDPTASATPGASAAPTTGTRTAPTTGTGTAPTTGTGDGGRMHGGPGGPGGPITVEAVTDMSVAAQAIGIAEADLTTAVNGGQTIAAVAKAHNIDPQKVIDALVADKATELAAAVKAGTLTQAQADAAKATSTQQATDQVNGTFAGRGPGGGMGGGSRPTTEAVTDMSVAAQAIGITEADLATAVNGGQTIAAVAKAHNVDPQKVIDVLVADETAERAAAVKAGTLTQAQADALKAASVQRMTDRVNGTDAGQ